MIKGHQDNGLKFKDLTAEAQANVIADKKAKEELRRGVTPIENSNKRGEPWKTKCKGQPITGNVEERLRHTIQVEDSKKWWSKKLIPPEQGPENILWDVYEGCRKTTPRWRQTWAVKYGAGILPTRRNMTIRKHTDDQSCPCCGAPVEDTFHLFQCPNEEIQKAFEEELEMIKDYLSATTSIANKNLVITTLQHLRHGTTQEIIDDTEEERIVFEQLQIGQKATLNGMWTHTWLERQETYLRRIRSRKSAKVWLIRLATLVQNMTHGMWKTRNEAIHNKEDSVMNTKRHEELDQDISDLYRDRPHFKLLPTCDGAFFKRDQAKVLRFRLRKKELWVNDAKRILEAYNDSIDATSGAFLEFFRIPGNRTP